MVATTIERVAKPRPLWSAACKGSAERAGWCGVFLVVGCAIPAPGAIPILDDRAARRGTLLKAEKTHEKFLRMKPDAVTAPKAIWI